MPNCVACTFLKNWLNKKNIQFIEKDIMNDLKARNEFIKHEQKHTPFTLIETHGVTHRIVGFDTENILYALG